MRAVSAHAAILSNETGEVWKLAPGACAAWTDPTGRWLVYQSYGSWIARDRSLPSDPRQHGRDQERAFYTGADMLRYIKACS